jgi:hypothetical protein
MYIIGVFQKETEQLIGYVTFDEVKQKYIVRSEKKEAHSFKTKTGVQFFLKALENAQHDYRAIDLTTSPN